MTSVIEHHSERIVPNSEVWPPQFPETTAVWNGTLFHSENMKIACGVAPVFTRAAQGSALLHPGLFSCVPSRNWKLLYPESMKMRLGSGGPPGRTGVCTGCPGFRFAPPWAIFVRSLRELNASASSTSSRPRAIFRQVLRLWPIDIGRRSARQAKDK
jgi:hypothetical protein